MVSPPIPLIHRHRLNATLRCTSLCGVQPAIEVSVLVVVADNSARACFASA
jgi:hypothetical protein